MTHNVFGGTLNCALSISSVNYKRRTLCAYITRVLKHKKHSPRSNLYMYCCCGNRWNGRHEPETIKQYNNNKFCNVVMNMTVLYVLQIADNLHVLCFSQITASWNDGDSDTMQTEKHLKTLDSLTPVKCKWEIGQMQISYPHTKFSTDIYLGTRDTSERNEVQNGVLLILLLPILIRKPPACQASTLSFLLLIDRAIRRNWVMLDSLVEKYRMTQ